jgi:hypothetical protein
MADESHKTVTRQDLSNALASGGRRQPTTLMNAAPLDAPAWNWDSELATGEHLELQELRQLTGEQRERLDELTESCAALEVRERELREALSRLAAAGVFGRRPVVADLRRRGLL